jgi:hypothetical protein
VTRFSRWRRHDADIWDTSESRFRDNLNVIAAAILGLFIGLWGAAYFWPAAHYLVHGAPVPAQAVAPSSADADFDTCYSLRGELCKGYVPARGRDAR